MDDWRIIVATSWVLFCFAAFFVAAPAFVLFASGAKDVAATLGTALVGAWLTIAVGTPLAVAAHAFNWLTALLLAAAWPAGLWCVMHRGHVREALRCAARSLAFRLVSQGAGPPLDRRRAGWVPFALVLLPMLIWAAGGLDVRPPVPADFDTLAGVRDLLGGRPVGEPLASLMAVTSRISMTDPIVVAAALRLALYALTAATVGALVVVCGGHWAIGALAGVLSVWLAPWWTSATWAALLMASFAMSTLVGWWRERRTVDLIPAAAAVLLLSAQVAGAPGLLAMGSHGPAYLEHAAVPRQTLRIVRTTSAEGALLVVPPEQQVEFSTRGRFHDLAAFVARFKGRTGDPRFRFDLPAQRLFVFVELEPLDMSRPTPHVRFLAGQPAQYRVPRERIRLARLARELCDDYRRTHAAAEVFYDDARLRIYRFDL